MLNITGLQWGKGTTGKNSASEASVQKRLLIWL
ncbi:hypothetical protein FB441_0720 [Vibrio crassostreae]|nr:hypothetical protein FB441_0720 [Vibrio crassostreae]